MVIPASTCLRFCSCFHSLPSERLGRVDGRRRARRRIVTDGRVLPAELRHPDSLGDQRGEDLRLRVAGWERFSGRLARHRSARRADRLACRPDRPTMIAHSACTRAAIAFVNRYSRASPSRRRGTPRGHGLWPRRRTADRWCRSHGRKRLLHWHLRSSSMPSQASGSVLRICRVVVAGYADRAGMERYAMARPVPGRVVALSHPSVSGLRESAVM